MKKLLSMVAVGAAAGVAMGIDVLTTTVGVTAISSSTTNTVVSVSYADLATGGNIAVSNIVKTTGLTNGDTLRVYNSSNKKFKVFTLEDGFWKETTTITASEEESADPGATTLAAGIGIWLVRGSNWDGKSFTFYIYGTPTTPPTTPEAGLSITAATLCGNCKTVAALPNVDNVAKKDKIVIPANTGSGTKIYSWNGSKWQTRVSGVLTELTSIPPGTGFWYVPVSSSPARKLYW